MLEADLIKKLAAKLQTTELNIRREYVQHLFLNYFYRQNQTDKIFFKGGTALRLVYGSPRFSEDLDFSSVLVRVKPIEAAALESLEAIEKEGIKTVINESKITSGGYLGVFNFILSGVSVQLKLEISARDKQVQGEPMTVAGDFLPAYIVMVLKQEQLISQKIRALKVRQKPRDWYDLYFILRVNLLTAGKRSILAELEKRLKIARINFSQELKLFLPQSHWPVVKDFKAVLTREFRKYGV